MTVRVPQGFPVGATLSVYRDLVGDVVPQGPPVSTCIVAGDSTLVITGITPGIPYQVGTTFGGVWRSFLVELALPGPDLNLYALQSELVAHEVDSTDVHGTTGTLATDAEVAAALAGSGFATLAYVDAGDRGVGSPNVQTASYTLALADAGKSVEANHASVAIVVTVPPNSAVPFPIGTISEVCRLGAAAVSVVAGAGVTLRSKGGLLAIANQYSSLSLRKRATDEWVVVGDLA